MFACNRLYAAHVYKRSLYFKYLYTNIEALNGWENNNIVTILNFTSLHAYKKDKITKSICSKQSTANEKTKTVRGLYGRHIHFL